MIFSVVTFSACSTSLINKKENDFKNPQGVPWVESREYDVFVYTFKKDSKDNSYKPVKLHYGRYALGDKVNGKIIDNKRAKWTTNYKGQIFSDGGISLAFHENGSLKEAKISSAPGIEKGTKIVGQGLNVVDEIEKKELDRLEREKKIKETRKALDDLKDE